MAPKQTRLTGDLRRAVDILERGRSLTLSGVPDGFDAFCVADLARALAREGEGRAVVLVHVARDATRARAFGEALAFAAPDLELLDFPAWDCQPYDRVSPTASITARRMTALARLAGTRSAADRPRLLSTTVDAVTQRVPPLRKLAAESFSAAPGNAVDMDALAAWLESNGFARASTVSDTGEYAVRGGIVDLFPAGLAQPVRLDFFGDTLESIRAFDPETQRTTGQLRGLDLVPMSEVRLTTESIKRFRQGYVATFGGQTRGDTLYEAVSEGRRYPGLEHWLPLFSDGLDTLFDYLGDAPFVLDAQVADATAERFAQIADYAASRREAYDADPGGSSYKPLPADALYLSPDEWAKRLAATRQVRTSAFAVPEGGNDVVVDAGGRPGRSFAPERQDEVVSVHRWSLLTHSTRTRAPSGPYSNWKNRTRAAFGSLSARPMKSEPLSQA